MNSARPEDESNGIANLHVQGRGSLRETVCCISVTKDIIFYCKIQAVEYEIRTTYLVDTYIDLIKKHSVCS